MRISTITTLAVLALIPSLLGRNAYGRDQPVTPTEGADNTPDAGVDAKRSSPSTDAKPSVPSTDAKPSDPNAPSADADVNDDDPNVPSADADVGADSSVPSTGADVGDGDPSVPSNVDVGDGDLSVRPTIPAAGAGQSSVAAEVNADEPELPSGLDDDEPGLPAGLGGDDEPDLPGGLDDNEPGLPAGLDDGETSPDHGDGGGFSLPFEWSAFVDLRGGARLLTDDDQKRSSLGELRVQLHGERSWETLATTLSLTADLLYDPVLGEYEIDLEAGDGAVDLREASIVSTPLEWLDVKLGRQVITWGTGDLLFINDMFPKDWNAFLIGRDLEYLKAPSDAVKFAVFNELANLDLVITPRFDPDRYPDRRRLSSWDPNSQRIVGRSVLVRDQPRDRWFQDAELAARLHKQVARYELAAYAYRGYWKSPAGFDPIAGEATFPTLSVYGASGRRPLYGGIAHAEVGYYDSRSDRSGRDPLVRNSETRALLGFEREGKKNLTMGLQYYIEYMHNHRKYEQSQPQGTALADRARHLLTLRLRYLAMNQTLEMNWFSYVSPSDEDIALMPTINYSLDDRWKLGLGANLFYGSKKHTFFSQLQDNSNAYVNVRAAW